MAWRREHWLRVFRPTDWQASLHAQTALVGHVRDIGFCQVAERCLPGIACDRADDGDELRSAAAGVVHDECASLVETPAPSPSTLPARAAGSDDGVSPGVFSPEIACNAVRNPRWSSRDLTNCAWAEARLTCPTTRPSTFAAKPNTHVRLAFHLGVLTN